jgi:hypothetical protein
MDRLSLYNWQFSVYGTHERWAISSKRLNQRYKRRHRLNGAKRRAKGKRLREGKGIFFCLCRTYLKSAYYDVWKDYLSNHLRCSLLDATRQAVSVGGLAQALGMAAVFGCLIGACISARRERQMAGVKTPLVIAAVGGRAWVAKAMFVAGHNPTCNFKRPIKLWRSRYILTTRHTDPAFSVFLGTGPDVKRTCLSKLESDLAICC